MSPNGGFAQSCNPRPVHSSGSCPVSQRSTGSVTGAGELEDVLAVSASVVDVIGVVAVVLVAVVVVDVVDVVVLVVVMQVPSVLHSRHSS